VRESHSWQQIYGAREEPEGIYKLSLAWLIASAGGEGVCVLSHEGVAVLLGMLRVQHVLEILTVAFRRKGKGKVHPRTGHEGPEVE
jgi:hypothetical protein